MEPSDSDRQRTPFREARGNAAKYLILAVTSSTVETMTTSEKLEVVRIFAHLRMVDAKAAKFIESHSIVPAETVLAWSRDSSFKRKHASELEFAELVSLRDEIREGLQQAGTPRHETGMSDETQLEQTDGLSMDLQRTILRYKYLCSVTGSDDEWEALRDEQGLGDTYNWARKIGVPLQPFYDTQLLLETAADTLYQNAAVGAFSTDSAMPRVDYAPDTLHPAKVVLHRDGNDGLIVRIGNVRRFLRLDGTAILNDLIDACTPTIVGDVRPLLLARDIDNASIDSLIALILKEITILDYYIPHAGESELDEHTVDRLIAKIKTEVYAGKNIWIERGLRRMIFAHGLGDGAYYMNIRANIYDEEALQMEQRIIEAEIENGTDSDEIASIIREELYAGRSIRDHARLQKEIQLYRERGNWFATERYVCDEDDQ